MLHSLIRRECNRGKCVVPFCIQIAVRNKFDANDGGFNQSDDNHSFTANTSNSKKSLNQSSDKVICNKSIESNPYYNKYAQKIERIKKENENNPGKRFGGDQHFDEFKNQNSVDFKKCTTEKLLNDEKKPNLNAFKSDFAKSAKNKSKPNWGKSLNDILKLDLLKDKSSHDISHIWSSYHKGKDCIYAVIPGSNYDKLFSNSCEFPTFVYPVPRMNASQNDGNAYELMLAQFNGHQCHFTPLISYQTHKENAPPCMTISHYPELQRDKGIVLMFGEFDKNILNCFEAQCLANQLQWYYSGEDIKKKLLLYTFNKEPNQFKFMDLIKELEEGISSGGATKTP